MVVSARENGDFFTVRTVEDAIDRDPSTYVVVANETARHRETVDRLIAGGFAGTVLVEKPIFDTARPAAVNEFRRLLVAYNLRFHPVLMRLRELLAGEEAVSASVYIGQYLPDWRPGTDYRLSYSAHRAAGGGVLRDLSHDLDYTLWLFGRWKRVAAIGGQLSTLEVDSDDVFALLMRTERCPVVTLQLSYLDRMPRRQVVVNTQRHTFAADLIAGTIVVDGVIEKFAIDRDTTYRAMHDAILDGDMGTVCDVDAALEVLILVEGAERAATDGNWIDR